jgi:hypothetical protein
MICSGRRRSCADPAQFIPSNEGSRSGLSPSDKKGRGTISAMWRTISGFAKFSWALLAWWGRILVGAVGLIAAGAGAFGTPEQQQQQNKLIVLLSVAKWYWWVILALSVALCIVLIRSYLLVELRTLGLRIFEDRSSMQHALGSLEQELEEVERVWMICLAGSTLSANPSLFAKIDRVILPDLETEPRSRYMETFIMHFWTEDQSERIREPLNKPLPLRQ